MIIRDGTGNPNAELFVIAYLRQQCSNALTRICRIIQKCATNQQRDVFLSQLKFEAFIDHGHSRFAAAVFVRFGQRCRRLILV